MKQSMQTISARVSKDIVALLNQLSSETERTVSFHIGKALEYYLKEIVDLQIALDRLHDPTDEVISLDEAKRELGIN